MTHSLNSKFFMYAIILGRHQVTIDEDAPDNYTKFINEAKDYLNMNDDRAYIRKNKSRKAIKNYKSIIKELTKKM